MLQTKTIIVLCVLMQGLHVLLACRSLSLGLVTEARASNQFRYSLVVIAAPASSSASSHAPAIKRDSSSPTSGPATIAARLLSLLGGEHEAASVDASLAQQILSCLHFLAPAAPYLPSWIHLAAASGHVQGPKRGAIDRLIQRPPPAVADLARKAVEWNGDASLILNSLSNESFLVPDVEGAYENQCQLTKYTHGHRFKQKELNRYLAFLFEAIATLAPLVGFNVTLNRFDLFHGHLFLAEKTGRLGILFHAREYPAFNNDTFPVHLGFCQAGSPIVYDESMNLRNILWLAPMPDCSSTSNTSKWLASGSLFILDAHPEGIIYKDLVPDYVDIVRTVYEADFGTVVVDVNYFSTLDDKPEDRIFIC